MGGGQQREKNKLEEGHNKWMEGVEGKECIGGADRVGERPWKVWGGRHEIESCSGDIRPRNLGGVTHFLLHYMPIVMARPVVCTCCCKVGTPNTHAHPYKIWSELFHPLKQGTAIKVDSISVFSFFTSAFFQDCRQWYSFDN